MKGLVNYRKVLLSFIISICFSFGVVHLITNKLTLGVIFSLVIGILIYRGTDDIGKFR